ncbi:hypothetical protein SPSIL_006680 [Sporomusa silvacetica DSM 10669]|uniref:Uncharacterized protein n=1 Tax=Sporomusa silvacetica DSM 10669 TaxID=1123289 RepID=A0ABZ3IFV3_9FIRM|nr:hypothetical protein SPSIL_37030 [Sporomusa silvacetica DSM 10669]
MAALSIQDEILINRIWGSKADKFADRMRTYEAEDSQKNVNGPGSAAGAVSRFKQSNDSI